MLTQIIVATAFIGGLLLWAQWAYGIGEEQPPPAHPKPPTLREKLNALDWLPMTDDGEEALFVYLTKSYEDYHRTPHWRHVAERTKALANWHCERCGNHVRLEAHHATYANLGNEQPRDMWALCRECHESRVTPLWPRRSDLVARLSTEHAAVLQERADESRAWIAERPWWENEQVVVLLATFWLVGFTIPLLILWELNRYIRNRMLTH